MNKEIKVETYNSDLGKGGNSFSSLPDIAVYTGYQLWNEKEVRDVIVNNKAILVHAHIIGYEPVEIYSSKKQREHLPKFSKLDRLVKAKEANYEERRLPLTRFDVTIERNNELPIMLEYQDFSAVLKKHEFVTAFEKAAQEEKTEK